MTDFAKIGIVFVITPALTVIGRVAIGMMIHWE